jgi:hypothetical protein
MTTPSWDIGAPVLLLFVFALYEIVHAIRRELRRYRAQIFNLAARRNAARGELR